MKLVRSRNDSDFVEKNVDIANTMRRRAEANMPWRCLADVVLVGMVGQCSVSFDLW